MKPKCAIFVEDRFFVGESYISSVPTNITLVSGENLLERREFSFTCLYYEIVGKEGFLDPLVRVIALMGSGQVVGMLLTIGYMFELKKIDGTNFL